MSNRNPNIYENNDTFGNSNPPSKIPQRASNLNRNHDSKIPKTQKSPVVRQFEAEYNENAYNDIEDKPIRQLNKENQIDIKEYDPSQFK